MTSYAHWLIRIREDRGRELPSGVAYWPAHVDRLGQLLWVQKGPWPPDWVGKRKRAVQLERHTFADEGENAYGAFAYELPIPDILRLLPAPPHDWQRGMWRAQKKVIESLDPSHRYALVLEVFPDNADTLWERSRLGAENYLKDEMWELFKETASGGVRRNAFEVAYIDALEAIRSLPCESCGTVAWPMITRPEAETGNWWADPSAVFRCRRCGSYLGDPFAYPAIRCPAPNYPHEGVVDRSELRRPA